MTVNPDLAAWLADLSALAQQYQALAAPIKVHIKLLEVELADKTAALIFGFGDIHLALKDEASRENTVPVSQLGSSTGLNIPSAPG